MGRCTKSGGGSIFSFLLGFELFNFLSALVRLSNLCFSGSAANSTSSLACLKLDELRHS